MKSQPQLYVRQKLTDPWQLLDTFDVEPMRMTLRVQDVMEPTVVVSSYSQTFRIPNTPSNGRFFQAAFNVNQTFFDPSKKAFAYIQDEGMFYMDGNIQLMSCYFNEQSQNVEYEITFFGETSDFASQIGVNQEQGFLKNLDLTEYDHEVTYNNIVASWTGGLKSGAVVYPLIEWGYTYANVGGGSAPQPVQSTLSTAGVKSFTSSSNPLSIRQFKPSLKAKVIWDAIFNTTEYTYSFTSSKFAELFNNLFVVADQEARSTYEEIQGFSGRAWGFEPFVGVPQPISIDTVVYDYGSNFRDSTYPQKFVATVPGDYSFSFSADYNFYSGGYDPNIRFLFTLLNPAATNPWNSQSFYFSANNGTINIGLSVNLQPGDEVVFAGSIVGSFGNIFGNITVRNVEILADTNSDQVPISNILPANIKQIDFVRSIVERFKLVFVPSKQISKHFEICPWDEWIQLGQTRDWSNRFNGSVDFKTYPLFQTQNRFVTFKDQEDNDFINYNWQNAWKQVYGQSNLDSQIEVIKGTKNVQGIFAPLPIAPLGYSATATFEQIQQADKFLIPHIAKDTVTNDGPGQRLPMQPKLRLAFYNGLCGATGVDTTTSVNWYLDNNGTPISQNRYPLMSNSYPDPWNKNAYILDWKQTLPATWDPTISGNPPLSANNTFENYWRRWYDSAYGALDRESGTRDYSTILECEIILNYADLLDLNFNDKIWIKDAYYLINSIESFLVGESSACKVQLYKVNNLGIAFDQPFKLIADVCYSPSSLCNASCCLPGSTNTNVYSSDLEEDLGIDSRLYTNEAGTVFAPNGYYAIGDYVYTVTGEQGIISALVAKALDGCTCIPELFEVEVCYSEATNYCEACCCVGENTTSIWAYDNDPANWFSQPIFYTDEIGTAKVADGYYSDGTNFIQTLNGVNQQSGSCTACNCEIYNLTEYNGCYDTIECEAVCCIDSENTRWYGDATTLEACGTLYSDQNGTFAPNGWYYDGISVVQVTGGSGEVAAVGDPADCQPCENEDINVYFDFEGKVGGTGTFNIYKSFDAANWMFQSSKSLATIPALTPFNYTGPIAPGTFVKGVLNYGANYTTGTFQTSIEQTSAVLNIQNTVAGPTYTFTPNTFSDTDNEYRFSVGLTGANLDCGITGASAWKCIDPTCIIDGSNSDYVVDYDLVKCCDPLYISTDGRLIVYDATLTEDANCETPPVTCSECGAFVSGNYSGVDYHAYPNYYVCEDLDTSEIIINYTALERPNRFSIYQDGSLVATSGWVGYADYPGPWGLSLSTPSTGLISTPYVAEVQTYVYVEAGPASPYTPVNDAFEYTITCSTECFQYRNDSGVIWTGDYQSCDGTWNYVVELAPEAFVCARVGTPFTILGMDLTQTSPCTT